MCVCVCVCLVRAYPSPSPRFSGAYLTRMHLCHAPVTLDICHGRFGRANLTVYLQGANEDGGLSSSERAAIIYLYSSHTEFFMRKTGSPLCEQALKHHQSAEVFDNLLI